MKFVKRAVMVAVIVVAVAGVYVAFRNLPIVSGCGFYGECPQAVATPKLDESDPLAATPARAVVDSAAP